MSDTYTRSADVSGKASDVVREFTSQASKLKDSAADALADNVSQLKETGSGFAKSATSKVESVLSNQKAAGADYITSLAQAAERAAKEFDSDLPQAANYIRQASQTVSGVADQIRDRELGDLVGELRDYARRQPTLVFGGAMLLGFAALRFLKSSAPASPGNSGMSSNKSAMSGSNSGTMGSRHQPSGFDNQQQSGGFNNPQQR